MDEENGVFYCIDCDNSTECTKCCGSGYACEEEHEHDETCDECQECSGSGECPYC